MWDPATYRRFGTERSRPFADLVARIGAENPRAVVDLGCGPGLLTATLAQRWPAARVTGVDSSGEMIAQAAKLGSGAFFRVGAIERWRPGPEDDVVVSNAALQWVPEHRSLVDSWLPALPLGGWLAFQVPGNFDAPSHRALRLVGTAYPGVPEVLRESPVDDAGAYAARLTALGAAVDAWETTYVHLLPATDDEHPVLRWMEGTALRPVRAVLDDAAWRRFRTVLAEHLVSAYPVSDGVVPFPFRRVFVVAHRQEHP